MITTYDYNGMAFNSLPADTGITVPAVMKALLLAPDSISVNGRFVMRNHGRRYAIRGGTLNGGSNAGLGALYCYYAPSTANSNVGARLAKV